MYWLLEKTTKFDWFMHREKDQILKLPLTQRSGIP